MQKTKTEKKRLKRLQVRKTPVTKNIYRVGLFDLFTKISDNTDCEVIKKIAHRLRMSRSNQHPLKVSNIVRQLEGKSDKVAVVVGKVLDDERMIEIPGIRVVALEFSRTAQKKIEKFGGECFTLDRLFKVVKCMEDVVLMSGDRTNRKAFKYFGVTGEKYSKVYPRVCGKKRQGKERRINYKPEPVYE
ncbi:hypothetical protein LUQ84_3593 [Hamiltosporidium tvaerminnensis]|nr:hypothetical protein LUQ84_3593 [Hamiltosporidium tvaerminnensis]